MKNSSDPAIGIDFDTMADEDAAHFDNFKFAIADYPLIAVFCLLFAVVLLQFLTRYVLNDSVAWTEEAARYLLIITGFAGAIRCQVKSTHITLEFMDRHFGKQKERIRLFALLMTFMLMVVLSFTAQTLIERNSFSQMVSLPFPKFYLYAIVMGLIVFNCLIIARQIYHQLLKVIKGN